MRENFLAWFIRATCAFICSFIHSLIHSFTEIVSPLPPTPSPKLGASVRTTSALTPTSTLQDVLHKWSHFPDGGGETGGPGPSPPPPRVYRASPFTLPSASSSVSRTSA